MFPQFRGDAVGWLHPSWDCAAVWPPSPVITDWIWYPIGYLWKHAPVSDEY